MGLPPLWGAERDLNTRALCCVPIWTHTTRMMQFTTASFFTVFYQSNIETSADWQEAVWWLNLPSPWSSLGNINHKHEMNIPQPQGFWLFVFFFPLFLGLFLFSSLAMIPFYRYLWHCRKEELKIPEVHFMHYKIGFLLPVYCLKFDFCCIPV